MPVKTFTISDSVDLEKVDVWWADLLRKGPKEIADVAWVANGDLVWVLKVTWAKLDIDTAPFNICMPAYAGHNLEELEGLLEMFSGGLTRVRADIAVFKSKIEDWEVNEVPLKDLTLLDSPDDAGLSEFPIDPRLSYASKLDTVEKIMVSEFLWPVYKSMLKASLMYEARIEEVKKEIEHRNDPTYSVVRVDRGMLRNTFTSQIGYDNQWLFLDEDELYEDFYEDTEED